MPILESSFKPSRLSRPPVLQTIFPALLRNPTVTTLPERIRMPTADGDFLDFDYYRSGSEKLAIVSHGLEGKSQARYVRGITKTLIALGYRVIAWNMRGCSGELNRLVPSYHSGFTQDLLAITNHGKSLAKTNQTVLIGFSVGGNLTLKLLGELGENAKGFVDAAVTFSVPTNLASSAEVLARNENAIYMKMFLRSLFTKIRAKELRTPGTFDLTGIEKIRTFREFDARFIAPLFGFKSAEDYWEKASSEPFLKNICIPSLLLTSYDDPFLDPQTLPTRVAQDSSHFYLEVTKYGGHVGFMDTTPWGAFYSEKRAEEFLLKVCSETE